MNDCVRVVAFLRAPSDLAQTIRAWLELTPEKVMFGTDAYPYAPDAGLGWSDTTLIASEAGREALGLVLTAMVHEGTASRDRAGELAAMVLREKVVRFGGKKIEDVSVFLEHGEQSVAEKRRSGHTRQLPVIRLIGPVAFR